METTIKNTVASDIASLGSFSLAHFVVDFCCAFLLFRLYAVGSVSHDDVGLYFLIYNALAFGLECLIGTFFNAKTARICSCFGFVLLAFGLGLGAYIEQIVAKLNMAFAQSSYDVGSFVTGVGGAKIERLSRYSLYSFILAGTGNAFFHVGGGIDALSRNIGKYWRGGVFISTGGLGIGLGGLLGREREFAFEWGFFGLVISAACVWFLGKSTMVGEKVADDPKEGESDPVVRRYMRLFYDNWRVIPLLAALGVVGARSYVGFTAPDLFAERSNLSWNPMILCYAAFAGKFLGGFCADFLGPRIVGAGALLFAIPALCCCDDASFFLFGVFLLNMTTAITLTTAAQTCVGRVGFAFGLTTLALLGGCLAYELTVNVYLDAFGHDSVNVALGVILAVSAIAIWVSTWKKGKTEIIK